MEQAVKPFRKIIHIDMDAFYASVEQRDFPEYRGKAIVVGGPPDSRGVVTTASYEARQFGVRSAMPCAQAAKLCPHALFVPPRFDAYKKVSQEIRAIFRRYTDLIEPLSLDEAYLDVTTDKMGIGSALDIARHIKDAIRNELSLTASAGVSINKFLAKIASDLQKPDGLTFIGPSRAAVFMESLPVEKFFGVGKVTATKMKNMGLHTGADLLKLSEAELRMRFGKTGGFYYQVVRGIDNRPVQAHRETKSVAAEDTFSEDTADQGTLRTQLIRLAAIIAGRVNRSELKGRTLTLKVKFADFRQITRSRTQEEVFDTAEAIADAALALLEKAADGKQKIRLLGISLSNFQSQPAGPSVQLSLFEELP
ncbi:DNA polymerase IV [Pedobacter yulinensis]|uniref:DNA polymerase IV n=1 Tax=Pedobacter yulinensis TaxID=2126353 RepID=A0A2T3HID5_9SPHI|nr:DNA polymerase IV [Pedobacter yulinensis]PST82199.1 DNA polymerase IV [Pedobacter yulinensis]